jgi:MFS family permease
MIADPKASTRGANALTPVYPDQGWPSRRASRLWLAVLLCAYASSYIDRQILSLMVGPIKADLGITDSQFSLLHGLSFAMFYCVLGLPVGDLVDRVNRGRLIAGGIVLWSLMTALCGTASSFGRLFLTRIGVGAGEAILNPAAYSLLADCFPPHRLGRALSIYIAGAGIGAGIAFMLGGAVIGAVEHLGPLPLIGEMRPWQKAFLLVSLPGIPIAIALLMMREPARKGEVDKVAVPWRTFFQFIAARRSLMVRFMSGIACTAAISLATLNWAPTFLMRTFKLSATEVGFMLGLVTMVGIVGGLLAGAYLAEWAARRGVAEPQIRVAAVATLLAVPPAIGMAFVGSLSGALACLLVLLVFTNMPFGVASATMQLLTPNQLRGRMSAFLLFCQNGFGMICGPLIPALLTDHLFDGEGTSLGYSLAISITLFGACGGVALLSAERHARVATFAL